MGRHEGITCYERDEELCDDPVCQQAGCRDAEIERLRGELERIGNLYDAEDKKAADEIVRLRNQLVNAKVHLRQDFVEHYWDSLEPNRDLIMKHIDGVLSVTDDLRGEECKRS